jgi:superfamily I DNA/RNA helicase
MMWRWCVGEVNERNVVLRVFGHQTKALATFLHQPPIIMSETIKSVFDAQLANLEIDQQLASRLHRYRQNFINRNRDHAAFFGGVLLGVQVVRFLDSDKDSWFDDIIQMDEELLRERPRVSKQLRTVYRFVCVDEFQDTNVAQYRVLRALAPEKSANVFIVGDDDQVIYQWNGASPTRVESQTTYLTTNRIKS